MPDAINLEDDAVVILWEDAHRSPFPHRYLRLRCPCANCVDEMSGKRTLDPDTVPGDVKAVDQMPAGNTEFSSFGVTLITPGFTHSRCYAPLAPASSAVKQGQKPVTPMETPTITIKTFRSITPTQTN